MKKYFASIIFLTFVIMSSCDKIDGPYYNKEEQIVVDVVFPELDLSKVYRKILIEEYTGHRCNNCPNGHAKLEELLNSYQDTLIAIGIHAGTLADVTTSYPYDFRTEIGNTLYSEFGISGIPKAVINRTRYNNEWGVQVDSWNNAMLTIDRSKVYAAIQLLHDFDNSSNILKVYTKTTILDDYPNPVNLSIFIVEDHIISPQLDGANRIPEYDHKHVFRGSANSTYGTPLVPGNIAEKDSSYLLGFNIDFSDKDWKVENTYIVVLLHDPATKEVLQVEVLKNVSK